MNYQEIQARKAKVCLANMRLSTKTLNKMAKGTNVYYKLVKPDSGKPEAFDWSFRIPTVQAKQKDHPSSTKAISEQETMKKLSKLSITKPKKTWNGGHKHKKQASHKCHIVEGIRAISTSPLVQSNCVNQQ